MRIKFLLPILAIVLALSACAPAAAPAANAPTIDITGSGTIHVTPDVAYVYIGVHTEDFDIAQAVANNNAQAQAVVNALLGSGVEAKDIQTSNFSVWSFQVTDPTTGLSNGTKYSVDNTVYITVRDLAKLGELLDTAIGAGANNINSISFDVADKTAAMQEARKQALESAGSLATELAQASGLTLGGIQKIVYTDISTAYYAYGMGGGGGGAESPSAPINPGQVQITATVQVIYAVK